MPVRLVLVEEVEGIRGSLATFNKGLRQNHDLARDLLRRTTYWVYSPTTGAFGPSKFVGFKNMNFTDYARARKGDHEGARFSGSATRKAIEYVLKHHCRPDTQLSDELIGWGQASLGTEVFSGISREKWKFISISTCPEIMLSAGDRPVALEPA